MSQDERPSGHGFDGADGTGGTDHTQDDVRRLLAEVRTTDPVPAEVAARLDQTLAALQAERAAGGSAGAGSGTEASVVPLRRRLGRVLLAAAAVAVLATGGVGLAQVVRDGGADQQTSTSAGGAAAAEDSAGGSTAGGTADRAGDDALSSLAITPALTSDRFDADVVQAMRSLAAVGEHGALDRGTATAPPELSDTDSTAGEAPRSYRRGEAPPVTATPLAQDAPQAVTGTKASCPGPEPAGAVTVPATLDGTPVALVFRPPTARAQVVEAWSCDGGSLLRSTTVAH